MNSKISRFTIDELHSKSNKPNFIAGHHELEQQFQEVYEYVRSIYAVEANFMELSKNHENVMRSNAVGNKLARFALHNSHSGHVFMKPVGPEGACYHVYGLFFKNNIFNVDDVTRNNVVFSFVNKEDLADAIVRTDAFNVCEVSLDDQTYTVMLFTIYDVKYGFFEGGHHEE